MQELSCFKGWPVTFLTTGQFETIVGFIYMYRNESHFCAIATTAYFICWSTESTSRLKTNPAVHRVPHDINDIYYDKKSSLL